MLNICDESTINSYSKAGKIISNKIGKRIINNIHISRALARNIVLSFNQDENATTNKKINNSKRTDRYKLIGFHVCVFIDNNLLEDTVVQ